MVRLCQQANETEFAGDAERQRALLREAWDATSSPYDRAVAAHYIARIQPTPQASHHWNRTALDEGRAAREEARDLMPSLLLAFGASLESVGSPARAVEAFREALEASLVLGETGEGYAKAARDGIERAGAG